MIPLLLIALDGRQEHLKIADIYEEYRQLCMAVAMNFLKNDVLAQDVLHETFVSIIKHKETFFSLKCSEMPSWIVTITKHKCLDLLRKQNRMSDMPIDDIAERPSEDIAPYEYVANKEGFEALVGFISELGESYKTVLELKYIHSLSNDEIASVLDISKKNVEMRLYRGKAKLKERILAECAGNEKRSYQ
jgi:RNA polymerase sigma-70 factor (ECF subfamily)